MMDRSRPGRSRLLFPSLLLGLALLLGLLLFSFRVCQFAGSSMAPTLRDGDLVLFQTWGYTPRQGDIVLLEKPGFPPPPMDTAPIIKRIIAVGGQHVRMDYEANAVFVDGVALEEPYILQAMAAPFSDEMNVLDIVVPEGSIYVMGDNRNNSSDSRHQALGAVDTRYVLGRVLCVMFPFQDLGPVE